MEYIILDLEWDNVYYPSKKLCFNQILQIGAVKLDENFNVIEIFSEIICSRISKKVTSSFAKLTGITTEIMRQGIELEEAVKKYNSFAKSADVTMTWSNSDLYTIIDNQKYLLKNNLKFDIKKYLDLQKLVQASLRKVGFESKNQISVESAAQLLDIKIDYFELHNALDDCKVCALMLKKCYEQETFDLLVKDATAPDFYARLKFKPYAISNINDSNINKKELEFLCPECNSKTKRLTKWRYRNRWFVADFECKKCHFMFNGRVMFKKTYDELQVRHKICEFKKKRKENDMQPVPETV